MTAAQGHSTPNHRKASEHLSPTPAPLIAVLGMQIKSAVSTKEAFLASGDRLQIRDPRE
jgi:hypothetical protein